jgi:hypothetical protein
MPMTRHGARAALGAMLCLAACGDISGVGSACTGGSPFVFNVLVRDPLGAPQMLHATAIFHDDSSATADTAEDFGDTLRTVGGRGNRVYDIQVTKRYYADGWARGVYAVTNKCGYLANPVTVPIVISVLPGAPVIRSLDFVRRSFLDRTPPYDTLTVVPVIDANPGVSRALRWSISGDTAAVAFDSVTGLLTYRCLSKIRNWVTATTTMIADTTFRGSIAVEIFGHPDSTESRSDPPCS